uniref:Uncharacterized protein n=1 Tax=Anguilla anguilla TaxID=7936 RepID=A0A0E9WSG1_ANGAN
MMLKLASMRLWLSDPFTRYFSVSGFEPTIIPVPSTL